GPLTVWPGSNTGATRRASVMAPRYARAEYCATPRGSVSVTPRAKLALIAATAFAPIAWGTTYAVTTEFLPADAPMLTSLMRALPAGLLLLALTHTLPKGEWWWRASVLGILNVGAFFPLLFLGAYRLP